MIYLLITPQLVHRLWLRSATEDRCVHLIYSCSQVPTCYNTHTNTHKHLRTCLHARQPIMRTESDTRRETQAALNDPWLRTHTHAHTHTCVARILSGPLTQADSRLCSLLTVKRGPVIMKPEWGVQTELQLECCQSPISVCVCV